jgi:biopolymer transport protein ExbD
MKLSPDIDDAMRIDMTPMVDAIFAIILFLLVCSSLESLEQDLAIDLPKQSKQVKARPPASPIVVNVRYLPGGKAFYHVNNERTSPTALTINLTRARIRNPEQSVVIRGDRHVKWDHVARVMTCCAQAGITKVAATVEVGE